jgi:tetratricopeptide (TPR) repeat protein
MIVTTLAYAGRKEESLLYAEKNYNMVMNNLNEVEDFDISYMYMQYARSLALNGNMEEAKKYFDKCLNTIEEIKDKEDKDIVVSDLNSGPWYGLK